MKNKAARLLVGLGVLLAAVSLVLFWSGSSADRKAGDSAQALLEEYELPAPPPSSSQAEAAPSAPPEPLSEDVLGVLSIPSLSLKLPVLNACDEALLERSVCRYAGTGPETAGFVIAGHSYDSHFGKLSHLKDGDEVLFEDRNGVRTVFQVQGQEFLAGDNPDGLDEASWDLTLFTCTFDGSDRLLVRCARSSAA